MYTESSTFLKYDQNCLKSKTVIAKEFPLRAIFERLIQYKKRRTHSII